MKKNKFSDEKLDQIEELGRKVGNSGLVRKIRIILYKLPEQTKRYLVIFCVILVFLSVLFTLIRPKKKTISSLDIPSITLPDRQPIFDLEQKMIIELNEITDSISVILEKEQISREESIYVATQIQFLENLYTTKKNEE